MSTDGLDDFFTIGDAAGTALRQQAGLAGVVGNVTLPPGEDLLHARTRTLYRAAYGVLMSCVCLLGLVGNPLVLFVLCQRRFSATTFLYVKALALADLASLVFWLPEVLRLGWYVGVEGMQRRSLAFYYAHCSFPLINVSLLAGSLLLLGLSVERYVCLRRPMREGSRMVRASGVGGRRHHLTVILLCPVLAFLVYLPSVFEYQVVEQEDGLYNKKWNVPWAEDNDAYRLGYKTFRVILFRLLPIFLLLTLNTLSMRKFRQLLRRRRELKTRSSFPRQQAGGESEQRLRVMLLIAVAILFIVCTSPIAIYHLIVNSSLRNSWSFRVFTVIADLLEKCNSALHFYIYCLASRDFRRHFRRRSKKLTEMWSGHRKSLSQAKKSRLETDAIAVNMDPTVDSDRDDINVDDDEENGSICLNTTTAEL